MGKILRLDASYWYGKNLIELMGRFSMARKMLTCHGTLSMSAKSVEQFPAYFKMKAPGTSTVAGRVEQRARFRTRLHWQVRFFQPSPLDTIETVTQNLSSSGFYCLVQAPLVPGELMPCSLELPAHHPNGVEQAVSLECKVRVIRVEAPDADGLYGIGCRIEDYHFLHAGNGMSG